MYDEKSEAKHPPMKHGETHGPVHSSPPPTHDGGAHKSNVAHAIGEHERDGKAGWGVPHR